MEPPLPVAFHPNVLAWAACAVASSSARATAVRRACPIRHSTVLSFAAPMVGKTLGKYRIVEKIGRGGMGIVYRGVDETLDRQVAIKAISPELVEDDLVRRFRAEAVTLAKVNHRNIATVYELFRDDDRLLMVMELVRGQTFEQLIEHTGPMPFDRAASLTGQILDALGHAHRAGIVHRA